ncbi:hypothetical protein [Pseudotamlana agarivorans]|uniref:hypothetical protein n=1 Tax=Pseudotamlana agarivorans TaxID=481183 RepID=UPI000837060A|nr:hypothetical protein [Tamlana agarivorans]
MDRNSFIKSLKENFNWLCDLGYDLRQVETSVYFEKHSNDEVHSVNFFWSEFDVIKIQGVFALIRFDDIEKIIEQKTGNLDYTIHKKWEGSIPKEFALEANGVTLTDAFYLSNESQVRLFSEIMKEFYTREIQLFFTNFKSVKNVLDWLNENDVQEHSKLLVVSNNSMMLRKLVVMKEGNSSDYQSLYDRYRSFLEQKSSQKESPYIEMYDEFIKFDEYFYNHQS